MNANKEFTEAIKRYLDKRAQEDELFAKCYAKPSKNIETCIKYIVSEARKKGSAVYMSDDEVYGLAVHYYVEENIVIDKMPTGERVLVSKPKIELTEEEKAKAKEQAMQEYKERCIAEKKAKEEELVKKQREKKITQRQKEQESMVSLF